MQFRNINYCSCVRDKHRGVKVLLCGENKKERETLGMEISSSGRYVPSTHAYAPGMSRLLFVRIKE